MDRRLFKAILHPFAFDGRSPAGQPSFRFRLPLTLACGLLAAGCDVGPRRPPPEAKSIRLDPDGRTGSRPIGTAFADLDGDGLADIVSGERGGPIYGYRYPGWERFILSPDNAGEDLAVADMDGDGWEDVIGNGQRVAWYRNPGLPGPFEEHILLEGPSRGLIAADLDKDGDMDLSVRRKGFPSLHLLFQGRDGRWSAMTPGAARPGMGAAVADLDGDALPDIVGCGEFLTRRREDGTPGAWRREQAAPWAEECAAAVLDVDRDGRPDLVLASSARHHRLSWLRNPGTRTPGDTAPWAERVIAPDLDPVRSLRAADVDGDGRQDILFAEAPGGRRHRVGVLLDRGGRGASWSMRLLDDGGAAQIAVGDVGLDGRLEVLAAGGRRHSRLRLLTDLLADAGRVSITSRTLTRGRGRPLGSMPPLPPQSQALAEASP